MADLGFVRPNPLLLSIDSITILLDVVEVYRKQIRLLWISYSEPDDLSRRSQFFAFNKCSYILRRTPVALHHPHFNGDFEHRPADHGNCLEMFEICERQQ